MNKVMIVLFSMSLAQSAFAAGEDCLQCGTMKSLIARAGAIQAKSVNTDTIKDQDDLVDVAGPLIYKYIKLRTLNLATAKVVMTLTAKVVPFANQGTVGDDNAQTFRARWAQKDSVFHQAIDEIVAENKITESEKREMLIELGAIVQAAPKRRAPQSAAPLKPKAK